MGRLFVPTNNFSLIIDSWNLGVKLGDIIVHTEIILSHALV